MKKKVNFYDLLDIGDTATSLSPFRGISRLFGVEHIKTSGARPEPTCHEINCGAKKTHAENDVWVFYLGHLKLGRESPSDFRKLYNSFDKVRQYR